MIYARAVKNIRKQTGKKQKEFAKLIGITQPYLSQIETGKKTPSTDLLDKMGSVSGLPHCIALFLAINTEDVPEDRRALFTLLRPYMAELIREHMPEVTIRELK